jgi:SET domain-containing protein
LHVAMQVPYELKQSPIAGLGIFATALIARGTLLWKYDENSVKEYEEAALRARLAPLSAAEAVELCEHVFCWEGKVCEIVDDGKYWNHAKGSKQNTGNHPDGDAHGDGMSSYALRDIAAGEELTDDYALYDKLPWFEAICQERGVTGSCTEVGRQFD